MYRIVIKREGAELATTMCGAPAWDYSHDASPHNRLQFGICESPRNETPKEVRDEHVALQAARGEIPLTRSTRIK
jgi:hypothetical protein